MKHAIIRDGIPVELGTREWWVDADGFTHSPRAFISTVMLVAIYRDWKRYG